MASDNKTKSTDASVDAYLASVENEKRRADAIVVRDLMARVTGCEPRMWGTSIIGFDSYRYRTAAGRKGELPITGVSPRKQALSVYIMPGFEPYRALMDRLGKHKTGKACLYINKLEDIDLAVLEEIVDRSVADMRTKYLAAAGA